MFELFKNTGIQYFGQSARSIDFGSLRNVDYGDDSFLFDYAYRILLNEWLPLSLDENRNLVRFLLGRNDAGQHHILYCIDTTIRDDEHYKTSLVKDDEASTLEISSKISSSSSTVGIDDLMVKDSVKSWLTSISERKHQRLVNNQKKFEEGYNVNHAYRVLIKELINKTDENNYFIPTITILSDLARAAETIETHLSIDLGNTRTIGLFVEKDPNTGSYKLGNAAPLQILNYERLQLDGQEYLDKYSDSLPTSGDREYLISSMVRFKRNIFEKYPDTENFRMPSMVAIGSEAEEMPESGLQQGSSGISGPKRYLWGNDVETTFWSFHEPNASLINGKILEHIPLDDDDDSYGNKAIALAANPLAPVYPKRTMLVFAAVELIYQAVCQVNSLHYRKRVGMPSIKRSLKNIILSYPTAMPFWERERLKKQFEKALFILKEMEVFGKGKPDVTIGLGSDEATCSQLAFLYGEAKRFHGNSDKFFKWVSRSRGSDKLRMASLDIGGGTTDLMIADYRMENAKIPQNPNMVQEMVYSDGVNIAGDDILESLITGSVIPTLSRALKDAKREDNISTYFGPGSPEADKQIRVESMYGLFIPIAEFYMHLMEHGYDVLQQLGMKNFTSLDSLNDYLLANNLRPLRGFNYLNYLTKYNIFEEIDFSNLNIPGLVPKVDELEKIVMNRYKPILVRYAVVVNQYKPNFLILGGRTTSLPIISRQLREYLTIAPQRIIRLNNYYTGVWYPFSKEGKISDPKTGVVIGNSISHLSIDRLLDDVNIISEGAKSDFTLNYIGAVPQPKKQMKASEVCQLNGTGTDSVVFNYTNRTYVLYRNINDENMLCNLMYTMSITSDDSSNYIVADGGALEVSIDCSNAKKGLKVKSVSGQIMIAGDNSSKRPAVVNDIKLKERTLFDDEYFLDTGKFKLINL